MTIELEEHEEQWLLKDGAAMLKRLGVKENTCVVDFGSGKGRYTIPLSTLVGEEGKVLAFERDSDEIAVLKDRLERYGNKARVNIINTEDLQIETIGSKTVDAFLAFDVLQYIEEWRTFFESVSRVIRPGGQFFIYPASVPHPGDVDMDKVLMLTEKTGLKFIKKQKQTMMHNKHMVNDDVYSFERY